MSWLVLILKVTIRYPSSSDKSTIYDQSEKFVVFFPLYWQHILGPNLSDAGRGINLTVLDATRMTFNFSRIAHFDTWQNSTQK